MRYLSNQCAWRIVRASDRICYKQPYKVPEALAARKLGHDFPTMSFGIYLGGADIETLRESIEVLEW